MRAPEVVCVRSARSIPSIVLLKLYVNGTRPPPRAFSVTYDRLSVFQGFFFEQEPVFAYKSRMSIEYLNTGLQVVSYTEVVVRVCDAVLLDVYGEYRLWFVPSDVIDFVCKLCMRIIVALCSLPNVREVLKLLDVIESTRLNTMPEMWRQRQLRAIYYHLERTRHGGDCIYYVPCHRQR